MFLTKLVLCGGGGEFRNVFEVFGAAMEVCIYVFSKRGRVISNTFGVVSTVIELQIWV